MTNGSRANARRRASDRGRLAAERGAVMARCSVVSCIVVGIVVGVVVVVGVGVVAHAGHPSRASLARHHGTLSNAVFAPVEPVVSVLLELTRTM